MHDEIIAFHRPLTTGLETRALEQVIRSNPGAATEYFTDRCQRWLEAEVGCARVLLTNSCTAALELAALVSGLRPGDEVIVPSYTYVSTANAFALRGAQIVFVDITPDTLNIDPSRIETAITTRTRAVAPVHYAGVGCEMEAIMALAREHQLMVFEDAAQGIMAKRSGRPLGSFGDFGAYSFHHTKNIHCYQGGALLINNADHVDAAELAIERGCDRKRFIRGEISKYTWQSLGSSHRASELAASLLYDQLEIARNATQDRRAVWDRYHHGLAELEAMGKLSRARVPSDCYHNAHIYHVILDRHFDRAQVLAAMRRRGVECAFHYVPLHSSPAGRRFGRAHGDLEVTNRVAASIVRLPLWSGMTEQHTNRAIEALTLALK